VEPLDDIRLVPVAGEMPRATARCGEARWQVEGVVLEGAWGLGEEILLATTDDIPQEDMLHLSLLGPEGLLDRLSLGGAYATGNFGLIGARGRSLRFRFIDDCDWELTVLPTPAWRLPWSGLRGVSRPAGLRTWLQIERRPAGG